MRDTGAYSKRMVGVYLSALHLTHPGGLICLSGSETQPWLLVSPAYNHLPCCLPKNNPLESVCAWGTKSRFIVLPLSLPRYLSKICRSPAWRKEPGLVEGKTQRQMCPLIISCLSYLCSATDKIRPVSL